MACSPRGFYLVRRKLDAAWPDHDGRVPKRQRIPHRCPSSTLAGSAGSRTAAKAASHVSSAMVLAFVAEYRLPCFNAGGLADAPVHLATLTGRYIVDGGGPPRAEGASGGTTGPARRAAVLHRRRDCLQHIMVNFALRRPAPGGPWFARTLTANLPTAARLPARWAGERLSPSSPPVR